MKNYKGRVEKRVARQVEIAKQLIKAKKRNRAKLVLRKKKYLEKLVQNTENSLLNLESLVDNIEGAVIQRTLYNAMKRGNECLSKLNSEISVEDVERLMDETREGVAYVQEVSDMLSGQLNDEDDQIVGEELDKLMEEEALRLESELPSVPDKDLKRKDIGRVDVGTERKQAKVARTEQRRPERKAAAVVAS